jgi:PhnB protein
MQLTTYLFFDGQCEAAFNQYARIFGVPVESMSRYGDVPGDAQAPPGARDKIIHARIAIGDQALMGSDDGRPGESFRGASGYAVAIGVDDVAEAERLFDALAEGGNISLPIGPTFFAERFGMVTDRFGIPWMVNCAKPG